VTVLWGLQHVVIKAALNGTDALEAGHPAFGLDQSRCTDVFQVPQMKGAATFYLPIIGNSARVWISRHASVEQAGQERVGKGKEVQDQNLRSLAAPL